MDRGIDYGPAEFNGEFDAAGMPLKRRAINDHEFITNPEVLLPPTGQPSAISGNGKNAPPPMLDRDGRPIDDVTSVKDVRPVTVVTGTSHLFETVTAAELQRKKFQEPQWIIPGLLPVGLAILAGRPKVGKSWLALNLAFAVAGGGLVLGVFETVKSETLYLALEDNERRLQSRGNMILRAEQASAPDGLHFKTSFARFDARGFEDLEMFLRLRSNIRLVIIDTLQRLRGRKGRIQDTYAGDYDELGRLQSIALAYNVAVVVVHHTAKREFADPFDSISGTSGITGSADTLFVLARSPELNGIALHARGRDIEECSLAVEFDGTTGVWSSQGDLSTARLSEPRRAILEVLQGGEVLGPRDIEERTTISYDAVRQLLRRMVNDGDIITPVRGKYQLPVTSITKNTGITSVTTGRDDEEVVKP